jgi:biopolymer transport protein ExbB
MGLLKMAAFAGGEWVIYLLLALSVVVVAVVIDRAVMFWKEGILFPSQGEAFEKSAKPAPFFERSLARSGKPDAEAGRIGDRLEFGRRLIILGSLGSLAPFIGLFGTVLGIVKAFRDLASVGAGHPEIVMQGIAEALVATAMGIFVAVICVAFYNLFNRRIRDSLLFAERLEILRGKPSGRRD